MDYSQSFSALNEKLRPRITSSPQLYSSLNRLEDRQWGSLRSSTSSYRPTVLPAQLQPKVSVTVTEPEDAEEPEDYTEQEDLVSDDLEEGRYADPSPFDSSCLISELNLKDVGEEELSDKDSNTSTNQEKGTPGAQILKGKDDSSPSAAGEGGSSFQRSYVDGTLPDLVRSGRPLGRRRTLGHVSDTVGLKCLYV